MSSMSWGGVPTASAVLRSLLRVSMCSAAKACASPAETHANNSGNVSLCACVRLKPAMTCLPCVSFETLRARVRITRRKKEASGSKPHEWPDQPAKQAVHAQVARHCDKANTWALVAHQWSMVDLVVAIVEITWTKPAALVAEAALEHEGQFGSGVRVFEHARPRRGAKQKCPRRARSGQLDRSHAQTRSDAPALADAVVSQRRRNILLAAASGLGSPRRSLFRSVVNARHHLLERIRCDRHRLDLFKSQAAKLLDGLRETAAPSATRNVHPHHQLMGFFEPAGRKVGQKIFRWMMADRHASSSNMSLRRFIASLIRDFTVPSGMPSRLAISGCGFSSMNDNLTTMDCSIESCSTAELIRAASCTRDITASAGSAGSGVSGSSEVPRRRSARALLRNKSMRKLRAMVNIHAAAPAVVGSNWPAFRQTAIRVF